MHHFPLYPAARTSQYPPHLQILHLIGCSEVGENNVVVIIILDPALHNLSVVLRRYMFSEWAWTHVSIAENIFEDYADS